MTLHALEWNIAIVKDLIVKSMTHNDIHTFQQSFFASISTNTFATILKTQLSDEESTVRISPNCFIIALGIFHSKTPKEALVLWPGLKFWTLVLISDQNTPVRVSMTKG
jgi:hypothetical protein